MSDNKLIIKNPYPFLLGEINAHVDRVLRDKGAATQDVSSAIMTCPEPSIYTEWHDKITQSLTEKEAEITELKELLKEFITMDVEFETMAGAARYRKNADKAIELTRWKP